MLGEMLCNTGGSQRTEHAGTLWLWESRRGHYGRTTQGLEGLDRTSRTESCVSKIWTHCSKCQIIKCRFLTLFLLLFINSVSADFQKLQPKGGRENRGYLMNQPLHQLHHGMYNNHMTGPIERYGIKIMGYAVCYRYHFILFHLD